LKAPGDSVETNWWQIWISTGILAQLLIKVAVTNFCVNLYRLADPLSSCGGRFEWPPEYLFRVRADDQTSTENIASTSGMPMNMATKLRKRKTISLSIIAFKWSMFWGILSNLCLLNLALATVGYDPVSMAGSTAGIVVIICLSIAVTFICALLCLRCFLQRRGVGDNTNPKDSMKPYVMSGHHSVNTNTSTLDLSQSQSPLSSLPNINKSRSPSLPKFKQPLLTNE
jgi:hypothetical protein